MGEAHGTGDGPGNGGVAVPCHDRPTPAAERKLSCYQPGRAAVVALVVICAVVDLSWAHVGFAFSSRIDLNEARPRIGVWADLDHVRGTAEDIRSAVVRTTILSAGQADCTPQDIVTDRPAERLLRIVIVFDCLAPPTGATLGGPEALGATRPQWVEIVLPQEARTRIVLGSEPISFDVARGTEALHWIAFGTAILMTTMAGSLLARGRMRWGTSSKPRTTDP